MEADKHIRGLDMWKHSYIKTYAAVDQDLKQQTEFDSFLSGSTALTIIKQVIYIHIICYFHVFIYFIYLSEISKFLRIFL